MGKHENAQTKTLKMTPKSSPGRPWDPLGASWGPFRKQGYVWVPFLDRFFDFFSDFGGPWGPPFSHFFGPNFKSIF